MLHSILSNFTAPNSGHTHEWNEEAFDRATKTCGKLQNTSIPCKVYHDIRFYGENLAEKVFPFCRLKYSPIIRENRLYFRRARTKTSESFPKTTSSPPPLLLPLICSLLLGRLWEYFPNRTDFCRKKNTTWLTLRWAQMIWSFAFHRAAKAEYITWRYHSLAHCTFLLQYVAL